jgi:hypothetical protein
MVSILLLSACGNSSLKEESKATTKTVKAALNEKVKKPNKKSGNIHFYLPFGYEVKDKALNNIILKNGSKTYILFQNPQENASSDIVYKASVAQYNKIDTNEKFTKNKKLVFLIIKHLDGDMNELTVGIGGTKITTQAKTGSLKSEAKIMMEIVNSVPDKK